jgi:hypothetical protein
VKIWESLLVLMAGQSQHTTFLNCLEQHI